jgi:hypothetical protein
MPANIVCGSECLDLARKKKPPAVIKVIKWFLPAPVARQNEFVPRRVMDCQREHAVEPAQKAVDAPLLIAVDKNLRVRLRFEFVPLFAQFLAQFYVVVEFAVLNDRHPAILVVDRLPAAFEIDDRESPHPHGQRARTVEHEPAFAVRPAMPQDVSHPIQQPLFVKSGVAVDAAHGDQESKRE